MNDISEISQLALRERQARVRGLADELQACFHPDATVTTSWSSGSAAAFVAGACSRDTARTGAILNRVAPPVVHHEGGDRAVVELPSTTTRWIPVNEVEAVLSSYMRLVYRVERRDSGWRISDLTAINESDTLEPAIPGSDLQINLSALEGLRPSYRWLAYTRSLEGGTVSDDLHGIDHPETVDTVYSEAFSWMRTTTTGRSNA